MSSNNTPAERLVGTKLSSGWTVVELLKVGKRAGGNFSGGHFSVSYRVEKDGRQAFLKAIDLVAALKHMPDLMEGLSILTQEFNFERQLHQLCLEKKLKRIVRSIDSGQITVEKLATDQTDKVPYLIMELADSGDIRNWVVKSTQIEDSIRFSYLRDVMTGVKQLHSEKIAHQDLKPSNVMVFSQDGAKLGDLGRAICAAIPSWHDGASIAGDLAYAPPEQLYGYELSEWIDKRAKCDLYQVGSLIVYLFTGTPLNGHIMRRIEESVRPVAWGGDSVAYTQVIPYWISMLTLILDELKVEGFPEWAAEEVAQLVKQACFPDYKLRGFERSIRSNPNDLGLDRFISKLDQLSKLALIDSARARARARG